MDCFWVFYFGFVNLSVVGGLFGLVLWWFVFLLVLGLGIWIVWMCLGWCVFCFVVVWVFGVLLVGIGLCL